jgi:hypothetical protein
LADSLVDVPEEAFPENLNERCQVPGGRVVSARWNFRITLAPGDRFPFDVRSGAP